VLQLRVKFRTPQLEHEFGCPYQLGHHRYANSPSDADLSTLPVVAGDIIIMGSDGLLDNMSDKEMVQQVRWSLKQMNRVCHHCHYCQQQCSRWISDSALPGLPLCTIIRIGRCSAHWLGFWS
jgi:hypothetical protein